MTLSIDRPSSKVLLNVPDEVPEPMLTLILSESNTLAWRLPELLVQISK